MSGFLHPEIVADLRARHAAMRTYRATIARQTRAGPATSNGGVVAHFPPITIATDVPVRLSVPTAKERELVAGAVIDLGVERAAFAHDVDVRLGDVLTLTPPGDRAAYELVRTVTVIAAPPVGRAVIERVVLVAAQTAGPR